MAFKDHFSDKSSEYARFRPTYPDALYRWLLRVVPGHDRAWDCATGNGQAALALAPHFREVVATDGSERQIANAVPADNVAYRVALAEDSGIDDASVDLVAVAQALHWFDLDGFYAEVRRVCRDDAVLAAWTYSAADIPGPVGALVKRFHDDTVGPWWPPERAHVVDGYRRLPFPFEALDAPPLAIRLRVSAAQLVGYLGTWSATRACQRETGGDPLVAFARQLAQVWPAGDTVQELRMPVVVRAGRVRMLPPAASA